MKYEELIPALNHMCRLLKPFAEIKTGSVMTDKIVELIIERSRHADGQNVAARIHTVLMEVRQAVAKVIAAEQTKEREQNKPIPNTCD